MEEGKFEYNNKKYGLIWEHKGNKIIEEKRKSLNCLECHNNSYESKIELLKLKQEVEKLSREIDEFVEQTKKATTKN